METTRQCTPEEVVEIEKRIAGGYLQNGDGKPDEDRSFDCKKCGKHYIPKTSQWIFYNLCDECFVVFDREKMAERMEEFTFGTPVE